MERWGSCPSCDRPVRLTLPELEAKRGFCAVCDATFDLRRGAVRDNMLPYRDRGAALALLVTRPPHASIVAGDAALTLHARDREALEMSPRGSLFVGAAYLVFLAGAILSGLGWLVLFFSMLWTLIAVGGPILGLVRRGDRAADHVDIADGVLRVERSAAFFGASQRLRLASIAAMRVEHGRLRVESKTGEVLVIGGGLGQDEAALSWVKEWLIGEIEQAFTRV